MVRFLAALGCLSLATSASLAGEPFNCKATAQDCLESMSAKLKSSGWVGIEFQEDSYTVTKVIPGSPAVLTAKSSCFGKTSIRIGPLGVKL